MTSPVNVVQVYEFHGYDGTNSADLLAVVSNIPTGGGPWYIVSEENGILTLGWDNDEVLWTLVSMDVGGGLLLASSNVHMGVSADQRETQYRQVEEILGS